MKTREQVYAELSAKYRAKWLQEAEQAELEAKIEAEKLEKAYYPEGLE